VRITSATTFTVGNPWKNWVFVRLATDEGVYGVGEGTANAFAETIAAAIHELEDTYLGLDPTQVELLAERMHRDVYTDGGQIHRAALGAIEIACWDIVGKSVGRPVHALMGGRVRDKVRVYANGWYQVERTPEAMAAAARSVVAQGYTALKFDPFGHTSRMVGPDEEALAIDLIEAVRDAIGPRTDLLIEGHCRFGVAQAIRFAQRMAPANPLWFEEPVPHQDPDSVVEVALRSPVPIATGESFASPKSFAALLRRGGVRIWQPDPMHLGGLWPTRNVIAMADASDIAVAPHSAAGPICSAVCLQLAACSPNLFLQELFDEFNTGWTRDIVDHHLETDAEGFLAVSDRPGIGIDLDWERLGEHPARRGNRIRLFERGWELRKSADDGDA
jgi:galactonate dehydratase